MADILILPVVTTLDVPAERILNGALERGLTKCVVLGYEEDGTEYFASSMADGGDVVWLMERCKHRLMKITDKD